MKVIVLKMILLLIFIHLFFFSRLGGSKVCFYLLCYVRVVALVVIVKTLRPVTSLNMFLPSDAVWSCSGRT